MASGTGEGAALGDHYAAMVRSGRRAAPKPPELPRGTIHIWNVFARLNSRRGSSGFGPLPISYGEIESYMRVLGERLAPWEVEAISGLDDQWLAARAKKE